MSIKEKISRRADANLQISFDVGHSSIGWAALEQTGGRDGPDRDAPRLLARRVRRGDLQLRRRAFLRFDGRDTSHATFLPVTWLVLPS